MMGARGLYQFNMAATAVWCLLGVPTLIWWKDSLLWVALMSLWANIASHWAAAIAAQAAVTAEDA